MCIFQNGRATKAIRSERHFSSKLLPLIISPIFMGLLIKNKGSMLEPTGGLDSYLPSENT